MLNINFSISSIICGFENPQSGRRTLYRKILRTRFPYVTWKDQLEIIETFGNSISKTDRTWTCKLLTGQYQTTLDAIELLYATKRVRILKEMLKKNYILYIQEPAVKKFFQTYY